MNDAVFPLIDDATGDVDDADDVDDDNEIEIEDDHVEDDDDNVDAADNGDADDENVINEHDDEDDDGGDVDGRGGVSAASQQRQVHNAAGGAGRRHSVGCPRGRWARPSTAFAIRECPASESVQCPCSAVKTGPLEEVGPEDLGAVRATARGPAPRLLPGARRVCLRDAC